MLSGTPQFLSLIHIAVCDKALILSQGHLAAVVDLAAEERDLEELFLELTAPEETSDKKED